MKDKKNNSSDKKKSFGKKPFNKKGDFKKRPPKQAAATKVDDGKIRLNKFIANAGNCSRREADVLIQTGVVEVNGEIITEMGYKVAETDKVVCGGQTLRAEKKVYLLMNKPKGFVSALNDPYNRRHVAELLGKLKQSVIPVDPLGKDATGVLLLTNDEAMVKRLTHPKQKIKKIYQVATSTNVSKLHLNQLKEGVELESGKIKMEEATYVGDGENKKLIGVEINDTKNNVVKKMFEHLGYEVSKLDRVYFAGLTKKNLARGQWRFLTQDELNLLQMTTTNVVKA